MLVSSHVPELGHIVRQLGFAQFFHAVSDALATSVRLRT